MFAFPGRQRQTRERQQSYPGFRRRFIRAVAAAGLGDVTPHDLRATHASWVADSHGVLAAARRLGHTNASVTTRHYARVLDERDARSPSTSTTSTRTGHRARSGHESLRRSPHDR
ncbi:tyrosine-type recombinase/integrase [Actinoplanes sp. RD1]|uniref:tyrosine-type recombinase/integrase n=1 Tax=Actinoplanes sp. RD1 TaxID=3064538 RepID=UPI003555DA52